MFDDRFSAARAAVRKTAAAAPAYAHSAGHIDVAHLDVQCILLNRLRRLVQYHDDDLRQGAPLQSILCIADSHHITRFKRTTCTLCVPCMRLAVCVHLEALRQLLHVGYNVRVYALTDSDAVQARPIKEVRMIHLGAQAHGVTHLQVCTSACRCRQTHTHRSHEQYLMDERFDEFRYHGNILSCIRRHAGVRAC